MYVGGGLRRAGEVTDTNETMRLAWFTPGEVWEMIAANEIRDGLALTSLLWYLARSFRQEP